MNFQRVNRSDNPREHSDCAVLALSICLGCSYKCAHEIFSEAGRHFNSGTSVYDIRTVMEHYQFKLRTDLYNISLKELLTHTQRGTFYVLVRNHAFAIVDGTVFDFQEPNTRLKIERVYEKINTTTSTVSPSM